MGTVAAQPERLSASRCDETSLIEIVERAMHPSASEWLFLRELRVGTGRQNGGPQRLDAFALNTLPHTAMKRICYEVKTSRADFLFEIKRPLKRRMGMRYSNEFYFVTPAALVNVAEIPPECGLVEAGLATFVQWKELFGRHAGFFNYDPESRAYCMVTVPAPWRDTPGPTWQLVAAMMRNQRRQFSELPPPRPVQERLQLLIEVVANQVGSRQMTVTDFRRIALTLEGVEEYSHVGLPAFRVGGRKFASLASQAQGYGNLMLTLEQQAAFVEEAPEIFLPIPGGWGRMGHTHIRLAEANEDVLRGALHAAWKLRTDMNAKTRSKRRSLPGHGGESRVAASGAKNKPGKR